MDIRKRQMDIEKRLAKLEKYNKDIEMNQMHGQIIATLEERIGILAGQVNPTSFKKCYWACYHLVNGTNKTKTDDWIMTGETADKYLDAIEQFFPSARCKTYDDLLSVFEELGTIANEVDGCVLFNKETYDESFLRSKINEPRYIRYIDALVRTSDLGEFRSKRLFEQLNPL